MKKIKFWAKNASWTNVGFFGGVTAAAILGGLVHTFTHGITWVAVFTFFFMLVTTLMSITGGYHRLFAHRSYECASWLKFLYLCFGAAAFQQSALKWASEHRVHHLRVDTPKDPYSIKRGFFWAHIGWILSKEEIDAPLPEDLTSDKLVMWQYKYWLAIAIVVSFGLPTLIGWYFGDALGGLFFGGFVRLFLAHHITFMINSLAHTLGSQRYSLENSAKDSWITAFFTFGEGYHNYHHWYARDYRNGIRAFHWDPTKWFIRAMSWLGQTWNLKKAPYEAILRAQLDTQWKKIQQSKAVRAEYMQQWQKNYEELVTQIEKLKQSRHDWLQAKLSLLKSEVRERKKAYKAQLKLVEQNYHFWIKSAHRATAFMHSSS